MSLLSKLKNRNGYMVYVNCPNCGARGEIKITKGVAVDEFVKAGRCKCETCGVVFHPKEYSTEAFDEIARRDKVKKEIAHLPKPIPKPKRLNDFKEERREAHIKWL
jgi:hypothetical protein